MANGIRTTLEDGTVCDGDKYFWVQAESLAATALLHARTGLAQYDQWYEASHKMPAGPERDALYHKMAREIEVYGVALIGYSRYRNMLAQPTVLGFKKHPILHQEWQYIDIDRSIKK